MVGSSDTNLLVRVSVRDNSEQFAAAERWIRAAVLVAIPVTALCELAWVLRSAYKFSPPQIATAIRYLLDLPNVTLNRPAVEAGLEMLDDGGDFADGVIAFEGRELGGTTFVSFDRKAVAIIHAQGYDAQLID